MPRLTGGMILFVSLALSCAKIDSDVIVPVGNSIGIPIAFSVSEELGAVGPKSVVDTIGPECIKNLWVVHYDGTGNDAEISGVPSYLKTEDFEYSTVASALVNLVPADHTTTVFFIANTFDEGMVSPPTLGEMVLKAKSLTGENDLFGYDGHDRHIIFSGWVQPGSIVTGVTLACTLKRNIAKINLHVTNSSLEGSDKVTVKGVRLNSVPSSSSYFPEYGTPTVFPRAVEQTINYASKAWPLDKAQGSSAVSADFLFYAPVNKRGTVVNAQESQKGRFNPGFATYAVVECTYHDAVSDLDIPIEYNFFLGANLVNDFNIENDRSYTFNIDIKNRGASSADPRIRDFGTVDFTRGNIDRSNCYILNPPALDSYWRSFLIPLDRINTFWGYNTSIYEKDESFTLPPGRGWIAEVIWSDFTINTSKNFRFAGGGGTMSGTGPGYFEVQIPKGVKGNVLVGVRRADDADKRYLWSWHLWITDYQPDDIGYSGHPVDGKYDYSVEGGMVHRLPGDMWTEGVLSDSFIMDRNLGALNTAFADPYTPGTIFYEFGRKDPFWFPKGSAVNYQSADVMDTDDLPTRAVRYSVNHPDRFIKRTDMGYPAIWTVGNKYNPSVFTPNILWNDPFATPANHGKSFFDPCPSGWKIPEGGAYYGLNADNLKWTSRGRMFNGSCFFPSSGFIASQVWSQQQVGVYGVYFTSTPYSASDKFEMMFFTAEYIKHSSDQKNYGFTARCVKM